MTITTSKRTVNASRRDDILKRQAEWQKDYNDRKVRYNEQYNKFHDAQQAILIEIQNAVLGELGSLVSKLNIEVDAQFEGKDEIKVSVRSNDRNVVNNTSKALSWNYDAKLKDGELETATGSWSGLQATTSEQLQSLQDTVRALTVLNNIDWSTLLNRECPSYEEYITEDNPDWEPKPNFKHQLMEADLEDAIGTNTAFKAHEGKLYSGDVYLRILRVSGVRYYLREYSARAVDYGRYDSYGDVTMNRAKLYSVLYEPLVSVEIPKE